MFQGYGYTVREMEICPHFLITSFVPGNSKHALNEPPTTGSPSLVFPRAAILVLVHPLYFMFG